RFLGHVHELVFAQIEFPLRVLYALLPRRDLTEQRIPLAEREEDDEALARWLRGQKQVEFRGAWVGEVHGRSSWKANNGRFSELPTEPPNEPLVAGESPIRVWREYRSLTLERLGAAVGEGKAYLSEIESGKKVGTIETLRAIATALRLELEDVA